MSDKVKVSSIVVVFPGGERREMTIEEAKALHAQLAELFGNKTVTIETPTYVYRDRWPRIIDNGPTPLWYETQPTTGAPQRHGLPTVWCRADAGSSL